MHHVSVRVIEDADGWSVEVWINGSLHDRIDATSETEARRIHADVVRMALESGGTTAENGAS